MIDNSCVWHCSCNNAQVPARETGVRSLCREPLGKTLVGALIRFWNLWQHSEKIKTHDSITNWRRWCGRGLLMLPAAPRPSSSTVRCNWTVTKRTPDTRAGRVAFPPQRGELRAAFLAPTRKPLHWLSSCLPCLFYKDRDTHTHRIDTIYFNNLRRHFFLKEGETAKGALGLEPFYVYWFIEPYCLSKL